MKAVTEEGRAPCTSFKIQIHGDKDTGKTSLSKKLRGKRFDENKEETTGIERTACQVRKVHAHDWQDINETESDEFEATSAWLLRAKLSEARITKSPQISILSSDSILYHFIGIFLFCLQRYFGHRITFYAVTFMTLVTFLIYKNIFVYRCGIAIAKYPLIFLAAETLAVHFGCPEQCLGSDKCVSQFNCSFRTCLAYIISTWLYDILNSDFLLNKLSTILLLTCLPCDACELESGNSFFIDSKYSVVRYNLIPAYLIYAAFYLGVALSNVKIEKINFKAILQIHLRNSPARFAWHAFLQIILLIFTIYTPFYMAPTLFGITIGLNLTYSRELQSQFDLKLLKETRSHVGFVVITVALSLLINKMELDIPLLVCMEQMNWQNFSLNDKVYLLRLICSVLFILVEAQQFVMIQQYYSSVYDRSKTIEINKRNDKKDYEKEELPIKLSLLDFAGDDFCYDTHHSFMATQAIYVVVFKITSYLTEAKCIEATERIRFWLNSIRLHAKGPILLVGTHLDQIYDHEVLSTAQNYIEPVLQHFSERYGCHFYYNGSFPYFCIDNSSRTTKGDDIVLLKDAILIAVQNLQKKIDEYPVRWRQFMTFVYKTRQMVSRNLLPISALVMSVTQIHDQVKHVLPKTEIAKMLKTLNDIGEVIYDISDPILSQYVVLEPQFLVDVIQLLTSTPDKYDGHMSIYRKLLKSKGKLHYDLLKATLCTGDEKLVSIIRDFLVAKHLIIVNNENMYTVPSKLPKYAPEGFGDVIPNGNWDKKFSIDFREQEPSTFIHRVIARLSRYKPYAQDNTMWRDGGIFSYHDRDLTFQFKTHNPCPGQKLVEVAVKVASDSRRRPVDFLRDLLTTMRSIQQQEFPRMWFVVGVLCHYPPPHDQESNGDENAVHILKLASETKPLPTEGVIHILCKARRITVDVNEVIIGDL